MSRLTHRGHIEASALLVTAKNESALQADVLALLSPGDRVHAIEAPARSATLCLLIQWAAPRRLEVALAGGTPLCVDGSLLTSFPLTKSQREQALASRAQLVFASAGEPVFAQVGPQLEPARWLRVEALRMLKTRSLGAAPAAVQEALSTRSARSVLGQAAPSKEALATMEALARAPSSLTRARSVLLDAIVRALAAIIRFAASLLGDRRVAPPGLAEQPTPARPEKRAEPPWVLRKLDAFLDALRLRAWKSALGDYLARKHAEYLARLVEMLDQGDLDAALRHAIPLSEARGSLERAPSLRLPTPRTSFALSTARAPVAGLGLGESLYGMLKARYRALYDRLIALDRIDDAAFVLAELLGDALGAVALLEKHGRVREAAELAEARKLEPAILVRQWIIAKDLARALLLARRHGAFEAAITHLHNEPEARQALACTWAEMRASSGDFLGALLALELGRALDERTHGLALRWTEHAQEAGGADGAVALLFRARLMNTIDAETERRARMLLLNSGESSLALRVVFIEALAQRSERFLAPLARLALRTGTRDRALYGRPAAPLLEKLEALGGGGVLREDRPLAIPRAAQGLAEKKVFTMGARGVMGIRDAVLLPNGQWLVALGEAGTRLLKPDGSTLVAFEAPSSAIVLSDAGTRALMLSFRGDLTIVYRMDTVTRRIGDAFELHRLDAFAKTFNGERWAVVTDGQGHVLDVLGEKPRSLFRLERCTQVERALGCISFEVYDNTPERYRYDENNITLRIRQALPERFERRSNSRPFHVVHEPLIAHLQERQETLELTLGTTPNPPLHTFEDMRLRGFQRAQLSASRSLIAFHAATAVEPQSLGEFTLVSRLSVGRTRKFRARKTIEVGARPSYLVEVSAVPWEEDWPADEALHESRLLAPIAHPNVVRVVEASRDGATPYIALEYVFGKDLAAIQHTLRRTQASFPMELAVSLIEQVCAGLHAAHTATSSDGAALNFTLRELAPRRVMVSYDGVAKLRIAEFLSPAPTPGVIKGNIGYISPERLFGRAPDRRSDVFVLGWIFYELLSGQGLFHTESDFAKLEAIRDALVPPLPANIPEALALIVYKALAKDINTRWQSAGEMGDALKALALGAGEHALGAWMRTQFGDDLRTEEAALARAVKAESGVVVFDTVQRQARALVQCAAHTRHRMLLPDMETETLVCFDDEGRLLALDLKTLALRGSASLH